LYFIMDSNNDQTSRSIVFAHNNTAPASATELMRIGEDGNVGIGTTSVFDSNTRLELKKSGNCQFFTSSSDASGVRIVTSAFGTSYGKIGTYSNHAFRFDTNDTERMRIDSSGNVGIGTSNPSQKLNVNSGTTTTVAHFQSALGGAGNTAVVKVTASGNSSNGFRIIQCGSSSLVEGGANAATLENTENAPLIFGTNGAERMRINGSDLVVGWTGGTYNDPGFNNTDGISLRGSSNTPTIIISKTDSSGVWNYYSYRRGNNSNGYHMLFQHGNTVGTISSTYNGSTSYNTTSDYRLKENVNYDFNALDRVAQLKPARFNFIADADTTVDGFLAHEVQDIVPEAIHGVKDEMQEEEYEVTPAVLDEDGNVVTEAVMGTREVPKYQGIDQSKLVPLLTKAIQELKTELDEAKARITELEG